jgi:uncharacterized protein YbaA (DUF1428 family)
VKLLKLKPGETAVFSWIVFKAEGDEGPAPRQDDGPEGHALRSQRMVFGGFKVIVDA